MPLPSSPPMQQGQQQGSQGAEPAALGFNPSPLDLARWSREEKVRRLHTAAAALVEGQLRASRALLRGTWGVCARACHHSHCSAQIFDAFYWY